MPPSYPLPLRGCCCQKAFGFELQQDAVVPGIGNHNGIFLKPPPAGRMFVPTCGRGLGEGNAALKLPRQENLRIRLECPSACMSYEPAMRVPPLTQACLRLIGHRGDMPDPLPSPSYSRPITRIFQLEMSPSTSERTSEPSRQTRIEPAIEPSALGTTAVASAPSSSS